MDPLVNPFTPGAGTPPPELAGRQSVLDMADLMLRRKMIGRPSKSLALVGLRGVGKTVLLNRIMENASSNGMYEAWIESPEDRSFLSALLPELRSCLLALSRLESAKALAHQALGALASFVAAARVTYADVEVRLDFESAPGVADSGDLETDLRELLEATGRAAASAETCVTLFVDELQYVSERELAALITSLHIATQRQLPITLVGAGLPQVFGKLGRAKSYAERLFEYVEVGPLGREDASSAIETPLSAEGIEIHRHALNAIVNETQGYPYFLQEWGQQVWNVSDNSPVTLQDVHQASERAIASLDFGFFRVRVDRMTPTERRYVRAMAEIGPGPHRSSDIASILDRDVTAVATIRSRLINKGMVFSPGHGDTAFTVPMFDEFMKRAFPELE